MTCLLGPPLGAWRPIESGRNVTANRKDAAKAMERSLALGGTIAPREPREPSDGSRNVNHTTHDSCTAFARYTTNKLVADLTRDQIVR